MRVSRTNPCHSLAAPRTFSSRQLTARQVFDPLSHSPHTYQPRCHGVDFWLHNQMPEADAALSTVFPDMYVACNVTCKLDWARNWIRAHMRDALKMRMPLVLGGVGALRPHSWRQQVLELVHDEVQRALEKGHPIGGKVPRLISERYSAHPAITASADEADTPSAIRMCVIC